MPCEAQLKCSVIWLKSLWLLLRVSRGCDLQTTETASIYYLFFPSLLMSWFAGVGWLIAIVFASFVWNITIWLFSSFINLNLKLKDGLLFRNLLSLIFSGLLLSRFFSHVFMMQSFSSGQRLQNRKLRRSENCNCRRKEQCPLQGNCLTTSSIDPT